MYINWWPNCRPPVENVCVCFCCWWTRLVNLLKPLFSRSVCMVLLLTCIVDVPVLFIGVEQAHWRACLFYTFIKGIITMLFYTDVISNINVTLAHVILYNLWESPSVPPNKTTWTLQFYMFTWECIETRYFWGEEDYYL